MNTGQSGTNRKRHAIAAVISALALSWMARSAWAVPGDLDPTFSNDPWIVTTDFGDFEIGYAAVLQPDGKLVVAGSADNVSGADFALARYNQDGSLDSSFGTEGKVITSVGAGSYAVINALVLQPDGKLVAAGEANDSLGAPDFALVRYKSDGSLDNDFDGDGVVITDVGSGAIDRCAALILQPDGKLVAAGHAFPGGSGIMDIALVRYNPNGSIDTTFDGDGIVTTDFTLFDHAAALVLQPTDNKLVVAASLDYGSVYDSALVRYNSDGSLDTTFDGDGRVITDLADFERPSALLLQPGDNKLVVAGYVDSGGAGDSTFSLLRFNPNGSLDDTFDGDGKITTDLAFSDAVTALVLQPSDNKVVAAGYASGSNGYDFALVRYNPNGSLDDSFDVDGKVTTAVAVGGGSIARALVLQPDGKLVAAGSSVGDFALVRYTAEGAVDPTLTPGILSESDLSFTALTQQTDGKLLGAGSDGTDAALARYLPDGSRDGGFGTGGLVISDLGGTFEYFEDALELSDGKLLAAGRKDTPSGGDFVLARYFSTNGLLDGTFGSGGVVVTDFGDDEGVAKVLQTGANILAIGYTADTPAAGDFALARYTSNGLLDTTFGGGTGKVTTDFGGTLDFAESAALQPDGMIVVVGRAISTPAFQGALAVARYNPDGTLDTNFATAGKYTQTVLPDHDSADVVIEPDGKIVVSSTGYDDGTPYQVLLRLTDNGTLDASFGSGGVALGPVGNGRTLVRAGSGTYVIAGDSEPSFDPLVETPVAYKFVRYRRDGSFDPSFGSGGIVIVPVEGEIYGDLILQSDGKAVLAGDDQVSGVLVRLQTSFCHAPDPLAGCTAAGKSKLQWERPTDPTKRKLAFKWTRGDSTAPSALDDPTDTTPYSLCVADGDGPALLTSVPGGASCDGQSCWKASPSGYGFKDKGAVSGGIFKIKLKSGSDGKAKALAKGKGANVAAGDGAALSGTVSAMLVNEETGYCAAATFSGAQIETNDSTTFKATAP